MKIQKRLKEYVSGLVLFFFLVEKFCINSVLFKQAYLPVLP